MRKYIEIYVQLFCNNGFVSIEDLGLTKEEIDALQKDLEIFPSEEHASEKNAERTLGAQLMWNFAAEILRDITEPDDAPEKSKEAIIEAINKLPEHERLFLAIWTMQGNASDDHERLDFPGYMFNASSKMILPTQIKSS